MLEKIFSKKYEYVHFYNNKILKEKLTKNQVKEIADKEILEDKNILISLLLTLKSGIDNFNISALSAFNQKLFEILKIEVTEQLTILEKITDKENYCLIYEKYRELYKTYISIITNQSWQSPDFGYSLRNQHGISQSRIYSFYNDYQKYKVNTADFEKILNNELTNVLGIKKTTTIFNSGMGAFSILLSSLPDFSDSLKLAAKNLYFEVAAILKYQKNLNFIAETDAKLLLEYISGNQPKYLFFDFIANNPKLSVSNLKIIFDYYQKRDVQEETFIIIDTTLNFTQINLNDYFNNFPDKLNIIFYRSLQKLDQYGMDMVTGGVITHYGSANLNLNSFRQMGTTPTEIELTSLENLDRIYLEQIYSRHNRNSLILASYLKEVNKNIINEINYPLIGTEEKSNIGYIPLFYFSLNEIFNLEDNNFFIQKILTEAKNNNLNIILGTSFGFNYSRMMITSDAQTGKIYIRFSAGRENINEVFLLTEIFNTVINNFITDLKEAYHNMQIELFRAKNEIFKEKIEKVILEKIFTREMFENIVFLLNDILENISKFKNYKQTKTYYQERLEYYHRAMLELTNKPDISVDDEIKKDIIRLINKAYS